MSEENCQHIVILSKDGYGTGVYLNKADGNVYSFTERPKCSCYPNP